MADPHVILAPIVAPPLPPEPVAAPGATVLPWALAGVGLLLVAGGVYWQWRRKAPLRSLRRIARNADARAGAAELARWQARHWPQAPQDWLQALERLRFGPPGADARAVLQRQCAEAQAARRVC